MGAPRGSWSWSRPSRRRAPARARRPRRSAWPRGWRRSVRASAWRCASRRWARPSARRAAPPAAVGRSSCRRWTSTSTSRATSTPSPAPTTCWRRCSTTTSTISKSPKIDPRRVLWRRVIDMNDRALRHTIVGLGGKMQGVPRETGFDITAASEVMAILCLAEDEDGSAGAARAGFSSASPTTTSP